MRTILPSLMLWGCSEYDLNAKTDTAAAAADTAAPDTDTGAPAAEECDGLDNDGDGEVDEGFNDEDGDGVADCLDEACAVAAPDAVTEQDASCEGGYVTSTPKRPWEWTIEWAWRESAVYSTPMVGDLDQDGVPEVVFTASGALIVLDGATGAEEWRYSGIDSQSGPALADLDGDGLSEVIATTGSCYSTHSVIALDSSGNALWTTAIGNACETYPYITDLEGDGEIEIIVNEYVLDADGNVLLRLPYTGDNWGAPVAADLDQDGVQEIMLANDVFDASGGWLFSCGPSGTGTFPQPINVDSDDDGELMVAGNGGAAICDTDGTELWSERYSGYGSPVSVADFDDDGYQELAFARQSQLRLLEADGSTRWTAPMSDSSGLAGTTSWDIDMDGVPEVIFADEDDILVFDGATGAVVIREGAHGSVTLAETPSVADLDGDGSGELLYGSNYGLLGITVIGSADGDWPYAPPVYNQYGYYGDNINTDLSVPSPVPDPWLTDAALFRGQPSALYLAGTPNLQVELTDVCAASCDPGGLVEIAAVAWNSGSVPVPAGAEVALVSLDGGAETPLGTVTLSAPLEPQDSVALSLSTTADALGEQLLLRADSAALLDECVEDDNEHTWDSLPCQ